MNKMKIKLIVGIVVLFTFGVVIGVLGYRIHTERKFRKAVQFTPEQRKTYLLQKYTKQLQLTERQQEEVRKIIDEKIDEIFRSTQHYEEDVDKIRQHHDERIKSLLTPEQRQLFDEMKQRLKRRWKKGKKK